jgi:predicted SnoaL-like aldol condensation-catalyzing enzyme
MPSDLEASPADDIPITEEDEKIAREVAMEYYSTIIINDRLPHVEKLVRIENFEEYEDYIPEGREKELVIAFYVTITSLEPKRNIILMRSREGIWEVVNEGY